MLCFPDQPIEAAPHNGRRGPIGVAEKVCGVMDPAIGPEDVGPDGEAEPHHNQQVHGAKQVEARARESR